MQRNTFLKLTAALASGLLLNAPAHAQSTTINVAAFADFAGPYANVMSQMQGGRLGSDRVVEQGSRQQTQRADRRQNLRHPLRRGANPPALWPGIKAEVKPAILLGLGGPDAAALQQRLPEDKIPMVMATATYGFGLETQPMGPEPAPHLRPRGGRIPGMVPHHQTRWQAPCQGGDHHLRSHPRLCRHGQGPAKLHQGQPGQSHLRPRRSGPKCNRPT